MNCTDRILDLTKEQENKALVLEAQNIDGTWAQHLNLSKVMTGDEKYLIIGSKCSLRIKGFKDQELETEVLSVCRFNLQIDINKVLYSEEFRANLKNY